MARKILRGIPVSAGISIGKAYFVNRQRESRIPRETIPHHLVSIEVQRLRDAVEREHVLAARPPLPELERRIAARALRQLLDDDLLH